MQQISKGYQCFDESLLVYLEVCLDVKFTLGCFHIRHISRHDNWRELAQQVSGYHVGHGVLHIYQWSMLILADIGKAKPKPTASATNEIFMQAKQGLEEIHS